jgi:phosphoribosylformylglycinamidine cyclo-ligase
LFGKKTGDKRMLDNRKIGAFLAETRRQKGLTQQQVANALQISFQAVSKWENGSAYPNTELLLALAGLLGVTVDEILNGKQAEDSGLTYSKAGVNVLYTDSIKRELTDYIETTNPRVLNGLGPFASLYDLNFPKIKTPVLVLKAEEPGSKQKLALEYGYVESICHDMINHLINDIVVMGAMPLAVLDTIVCDSAEKDTIKTIVKGISAACRENECALVGGETSVQPGVVNKGMYILTSCVAGIVDKTAILDGSQIAEGDTVLALASNGLHTNGYSLVRLMMEERPQIKNERLGGENFMEAIMKPHTSYYKMIKGLFADKRLHGLAHITGGGIEWNLSRIIPDGLCADVDLSKLRTLPIFRLIKENGNISDEEMLRTFNCGAGLIAVVSPDAAADTIRHISSQAACYELGRITQGSRKINLFGSLIW